MTISKKEFNEALVQAALKNDGRCSLVIKGVPIELVKKDAKKFEITLRDPNAQKPDFWIYRLERIAIDRFLELCEKLTRRRAP